MNVAKKAILAPEAGIAVPATEKWTPASPCRRRKNGPRHRRAGDGKMDPGIAVPATAKRAGALPYRRRLNNYPFIHCTIMFRSRRTLIPLADRGPLRVMFVITSMPVGGAETLLVELIRRLDRERFLPELCCLKYFDPLGEVLSQEVPAFTGLLAHKYDARRALAAE